MEPKSVLFVCLGNICRSPTAEGVMKHLVAECGLDGRVTADSAGTISYHAGDPPDRRMREAAARRGYELSGRSRRIEPADFERFDLILAMDRENLEDLREVGFRGAKVRLVSDFLPAGSEPDIPDPYYGGERGFDKVLDLLETACPRILDHLVAGTEPRRR